MAIKTLETQLKMTKKYERIYKHKLAKIKQIIDMNIYEYETLMGKEKKDDLPKANGN